jgi:YD repeat-containing protein
MITDPRPRGTARRTEYDRSDTLIRIALPDGTRFHTLALGIESAMSFEVKSRVQTACNEFLKEAARCFNVPKPAVRVFDARPLRVYETGMSELFGDYQLNTALIRVWMRTAVQKRVTSFGTFLNTLCHEFCHHVDILQLGFPNSYHTRGFYQRTAVLYHFCRGTPFRPLAWRLISNGRWRIDWTVVNRNQTVKG